MKPKRELGILAAFAAVFALAFWLPVERLGLEGPGAESLRLLRWYAREHVLLYFHHTARCMTCNRIEALTRQAVAEGFADEVEAGRLGIKAVNVEEPGNQHFVKDYELFTKSVVLVDGRKGRAGRWKNLDQIWTLVRDEQAFKKYVTDETRAFLAGK